MNEKRTSDMGLLTRIIATGGFLGFAPFAPATVGSLGCIVLLWFLLPQVVPGAPPTSFLLLLLSTLAFTALAVWASTRAERELGKDASPIVIDEFAGMLIAVLFLPKTLTVYAVAFVLFRILDILKPFPAARAESLPGGLGIVMDDVVAGIYANALIRIMLLVTGGGF